MQEKFICLCCLVTFSCASTPAADKIQPQSTDNTREVHDGTSGLSALQKERLRVGLKVVEKLKEEWPWMRADETCVSLITESKQWLLACNDPGDEFSKESETFEQRAVYSRGENVLLAGTTMPNPHLITVLPAAAMAFHPDVPSMSAYEERPWVLVSDLDSLVSLHPGFGPDSTTQEWLGVFTHELYHTQQMLLPNLEKRAKAILTRELDQGRLAQHFVEDSAFKESVEAELTILHNAAASPKRNRESSLQALRDWAQAYEKRIDTHSGKFPEGWLRESDQVFTYVEGAARYVETQFLGNIREYLPESHDLDQDPRFVSDFSYQLPPPIAQPNYFYAIGMYLCILMDDIDPQWKQKVHAHPDLLVGVVMDSLSQ